MPGAERHTKVLTNV